MFVIYISNPSLRATGSPCVRYCKCQLRLNFWEPGNRKCKGPFRDCCEFQGPWVWACETWNLNHESCATNPLLPHLPSQSQGLARTPSQQPKHNGKETLNLTADSKAARSPHRQMSLCRPGTKTLKNCNQKTSPQKCKNLCNVIQWPWGVRSPGKRSCVLWRHEDMQRMRSTSPFPPALPSAWTKPWSGATAGLPDWNGFNLEGFFFQFNSPRSQQESAFETVQFHPKLQACNKAIAWAIAWIFR